MIRIPRKAMLILRTSSVSFRAFRIMNKDIHGWVYRPIRHDMSSIVFNHPLLQKSLRALSPRPIAFSYIRHHRIAGRVSGTLRGRARPKPREAPSSRTQQWRLSRSRNFLRFYREPTRRFGTLTCRNTLDSTAAGSRSGARSRTAKCWGMLTMMRHVTLGVAIAALSMCAPVAANAKCAWDTRFKPKAWVCDDNKGSEAQRIYEEEKKKQRQGGDNRLVPIVTCSNRGTPPDCRCPAGQIELKNGSCTTPAWKSPASARR